MRLRHFPTSRHFLTKKATSFPSHICRLGCAYFRFSSLQPDTSVHCKTTDTGLVHHVRVVCMFDPQLSLVLTAPTYSGMARQS